MSNFNNYEYVLELVIKNGLYLQYASDELKNNENFIHQVV